MTTHDTTRSSVTTRLVLPLAAVCGVGLLLASSAAHADPSAPRAARPAKAARMAGKEQRKASGTPSAPAATAKTPSPALEPALDGVEGKQYPTSSKVDVSVGKLAADAGTMSFWLTPRWDEGSKDDASFVSLADGRLAVLKNVNFLRFEFRDEAGQMGGLGMPVDAWKPGKPHQVITTWSGMQFSLYVDGKLVSETASEAPVKLPTDGKLTIGSAFPEGRPVAAGMIAGVQVESRPLTADEVAGRYRASAATQRTAAR